VLDTLTEKDFQEGFQKWRRWWDWCLHAGGNNSRVMVVDRPYGEFYDIYSNSLQYFGYTLVQYNASHLSLTKSNFDFPFIACLGIFKHSFFSIYLYPLNRINFFPEPFNPNTLISHITSYTFSTFWY
jgi:hypothetical protein